ncbi:MAG: iron-sulfur cluster assembly accessory protein [Chlamydiales bacterium]|nr:iron-sulfur cluster assembly accessory protein [Chlamydiales bacterium]
MTTENNTITSDMTIEDILGMFPNKSQRLAHEISKAGLHCAGCHAATWETLEAGMLSHGKTLPQVDALVQALNNLLAETSDPETISLTPKAALKYQEILKEDGKSGWGLRFSEQPAGCSGLEYVLDYSEKPDADDAVFECWGVDIHVKKGMVPRLLGSEIDYIEGGLQGGGFKISNPNVKSSCGCGDTHSY